MLRQSDRVFGLTFTAVFAVIFAVGWLAFDARLYWALWVAGAFAVPALVAPGVLLPLNRLWGWFAGRLSTVNNYLLLGLFLYVIVTPMGVMMRLFGHDPMQRRLRRQGSYWTPIRRGTSADVMKDMF